MRACILVACINLSDYQCTFDVHLSFQDDLQCNNIYISRINKCMFLKKDKDKFIGKQSNKGYHKNNLTTQLYLLLQRIYTQLCFTQ